MGILLSFTLQISSHCSGLQINLLPLQEIVQDQRRRLDI